MDASNVLDQFISNYRVGVADAAQHGDEMDQRANRECLALLLRLRDETITSAGLAVQIDAYEISKALAKDKGDHVAEYAAQECASMLTSLRRALRS